MRMSSNALTLIELLVASILVGIVMLGIVSFSQTMKQMHVTTQRSAVPAARVAAALAQITADAHTAIGNAADPGICVNAANCLDFSNYTDLLCFRRANPAGNPTDWVCYQRDNQNRIWRCPVALGGVLQCAAEAGAYAKPFLQTSTNAPFYTIVNTTTSTDTSVSKTFYLTLTLTTREFPGQAVDPMQNPEVSLETNVTPYGQSW
ncbi:MAG: prepilin-type N-terminal cleavage/methylation domain-containing protein [Candidatus Omnitrophica bacterium]|nr:prepilin-type N-terminal cleavage/methylation domain-containing protein [Candidatus Omnitrophota bacterium]